GPPLSDYVAPQVGKYIIYRTDSTVFTQFQSVVEVHSYHEKQIVDAQLTDNLGRTTFRVLRYLRDTLNTQPWAPAGTFLITPTEKTVEVTEDNLRVLKLNFPILETTIWKGNTHLPESPYDGLHKFSNDDEMEDWEFTYSSVDGSQKFNGQLVEDIITVTQVDESTNIPVTPSVGYASINFGEEKYAKGIGLVYQNFIMWEYQLNPGSPPPTYQGFGIKRAMIDHN
ncbi:MAG: hypothetical protein V4676_09925, partial [Bacteroidota bacterium]